MSDTTLHQFKDADQSLTDQEATVTAEQGITAADEIAAHTALNQATILLVSQAKRDSSRVLHAYLVVVIFANFCLLFLKGYSADLGYWENWVTQLSANGYSNFNGNYPPFYVHWLYLLGKFYTFIHVPLEANNFLKFLTQIPVTLSHCLLTTLIFSLLNRFNAQRYMLHIVMLLTALNPTILVNGPIWGQVDLIPVTFIVCAILLNFHERFSYFAIPMFALALLTKFQMIAFAPVFGFLFFRNVKNSLLGVVIAGVTSALIFMPSIIAGHFIQAFKLAYIDTLGQYPMTTFNAANMWILLTSNTAPDSQILFGVAENSAFAKIFTAKYFGMLLFALTAFWIFIQGCFRQPKLVSTAPVLVSNMQEQKEPEVDATTAQIEPVHIEPVHIQTIHIEAVHIDAIHIEPVQAEAIVTSEDFFITNTDEVIPSAEPAQLKATQFIEQTQVQAQIQAQLSHALFSAMLCALAFFALLPAMHERYLFPAAILALAYVATARKKLIYPIVISLLCSMNMFIILEVNGSDIWSGLAWLLVGITSLCLLETMFGEKLFTRLSMISDFIFRIPALSIWFFIAATAVMFFSFYDNYRIHHLSLKKNQVLLTTLPQIYAKQDHGSLKLGRSYDGNILSVNNLRYDQGLGTHANSDIQYQLPESAAEFTFIPGLDDEVGIAEVQFSVWGDDKLLWKSKIYYGHEKGIELNKVDIHGIKTLNLKVDALKEDNWDHVDWINTVISLDPDEK